MGAKWLVST